MPCLSPAVAGRGPVVVRAPSRTTDGVAPRSHGRSKTQWVTIGANQDAMPEATDLPRGAVRVGRATLVCQGAAGESQNPSHRGGERQRALAELPEELPARHV